MDGTGKPTILRVPDIDYSDERGRVSLSPDGTGILTCADAIEHNPTTGHAEYWVTVWPSSWPFTGLDDPALWTATSYCPPVALRVQLLGVSEALAAEQLQACDRVAAARFGQPPASSRTVQ